MHVTAGHCFNRALFKIVMSGSRKSRSQEYPDLAGGRSGDKSVVSRVGEVYDTPAGAFGSVMRADV